MPIRKPLILLGVMVAVFALTLLDAPLLSGGWLWDVPNVAGFVAFCGLLILQIQTGAGRAVRLHEQISWWVLGLVAVHVGWLLLTDGTTVEYLKLKSPWYMLAGIAATLLLMFILFTALPTLRRKTYGRQADFRQLHRWLSWVCVALAAYHLIGSGFYLSGAGAVGLIVIVLLVAGLRFV